MDLRVDHHTIRDYKWLNLHSLAISLDVSECSSAAVSRDLCKYFLSAPIQDFIYFMLGLSAASPPSGGITGNHLHVLHQNTLWIKS